MMMTPNDLEILLHHYVSPCEFPRREADAYKKAVKMFLADGVFDHEDDGGYRVTEKGKAWIVMILSTPMPKLKYCDPRFEDKL